MTEEELAIHEKVRETDIRDPGAVLLACMEIFPALRLFEPVVRSWMFDRRKFALDAKQVAMPMLASFIIRLHRAAGIPVRPAYAGNCAWLQQLRTNAGRK